jgi:hypothetical protein
MCDLNTLDERGCTDGWGDSVYSCRNSELEIAIGRIKVGTRLTRDLDLDILGRAERIAVLQGDS